MINAVLHIHGTRLLREVLFYFGSHHCGALGHPKATTIRTLTRRVQLVCDSPDSLQDETDSFNNVFSKNNIITTQTLLDGTIIVTLIPTLRPTLIRRFSL